MTMQGKVHFRFFRCPKCHHQFEWICSRTPSYCPECGCNILTEINKKPNLLISDPDASIIYNENAMPWASIFQHKE